MQVFLQTIILILALIYAFQNAEAKQISPTTVSQICKDIGFSNCKLIKALVQYESGFNTKAYNSEKTGSFGLVQIQCGTAKWMADELKKPEFRDCRKLYEPQHNIKVAVAYLRWIRNQYNISDTKTWLAAYNYGKPLICKFYNPGFCNPGEFYNQAYVDAVHDIYAQL
jgi:membrane-bound lytic murein transglycosylase MltF